MNKTIRQITEKYYRLLPEDRQYYRMKDLLSWGIPGFIVLRIKSELERNLAESMRQPQTKWANMQSSAVQETWLKFTVAIKDEAWLPAGYAKSVMETAVADVLEMLVEPRKNIAEVVFGAETQLSLSQIKDRVNLLVVYNHFAQLLPQYMKKKKLEGLSKKRCVKIITKADEKVTFGYTPLNWAQMLEPLFAMCDNKVDSSMLRLFFEDRDMSREAAKFEQLDESVTRTRFIELLSSPEFIEEEYVAHEPENSNDKLSTEGEIISEEHRSRSDTVLHLVEEKPEEKVISMEESSASVPMSNKSRESRAEFQHEDTSLNTIFTEADEKNEQKPEPDEHFEEAKGKSFSVNDNFEDAEEVLREIEMDTETDISDETETQEEEAEPESHKLKKEGEIIEDYAEAEHLQREETPMWKRFMSPNELQSFSEEKEIPFKESEFIEEPIFDNTSRGEPEPEKLQEIKESLKSKHSYYVEEIFQGSEKAYEAALKNISKKKEWRSASRYIEKEVFNRNFVDMYSEQAIDFTDRLHNYFTETADQ